MNTAQAAAALGVIPNTILDAIRRGTLKAEKVGRTWEIAEDEIGRYRREHRGKQGRVSREKAKERGVLAHQTRRRNLDVAAQIARQNLAEGQSTEEDADTLQRILTELEKLRRESDEIKATRLKDTPPATEPALPAWVATEPGTMAADELAKWVRRAEAVALRLETVATRMEVSIG